MLLGNDGGMHLSYDRGASWLHLNNLPIGEFYAVAVDMDEPYNIYGGTQDDAALFGVSDQVIEDDLGDRWTHVYLDRWGGGDSYFTYRDQLDHDLIYYAHQMGDLRRKRMSTGENVTIQPQATEGEEPLRNNWMTPFFISQHNPLTLYYGANVLFKSLDRGDTWTPISADLTSRPEQQGNVPWGTLTSVAESPLQPGLLYAGADDGRIHVTQDDGHTWERVDEGLPARGVTRLAASQHDAATVYVSFTGYRYDDFEKYLYVSTDSGASWSRSRATCRRSRSTSSPRTRRTPTFSTSAPTPVCTPRSTAAPAGTRCAPTCRPRRYTICWCTRATVSWSSVRTGAASSLPT